MATSGKSEKRKVEDEAALPAVKGQAAAKYPKPKILLLDLPAATSVALSSLGFNVSKGTLGRPYKVAKSGGYAPVIGKANVPNYTEQEIIVIDFAYDEPADNTEGEKPRPDSEPDLWAKCDLGFIDPRVRTAFHLLNAFNRIFENRGLFVIFADAKTGNYLQMARLNKFGDTNRR